MTNYEKIKNMSPHEIAKAIYNGISSDPCDYCPCDNHICFGDLCKDTPTKIIVKWLMSEAAENKVD